MTNIGYKFYKEYFSKLTFTDKGVAKLDGKETLNVLKKISLRDYNLSDKYFLNSKIDKDNTIELSTIYPGLLIGSGYIHEVGGKTAENELSLGFFFDHTTGLPIIPASSVKGLLRSAFKKADGKYVKGLIYDITKSNWNVEDIYILEKSIFEGEENKSVYQRDIFFDAFPIKSDNDKSYFLDNDYITPHKNPLKNPNPIQFLKILPQVTFQFNFKLEDFTNGDLKLDVSQKTKLFTRILLDLGIGAKTNVGYGQFKDNDDISNTKNTSTTNKKHTIQKPRELTEEEKRIIVDTKLKCTVVKVDEKYYYFQFDWGSKLSFKKKKTKVKVEVELIVNDVVEIELTSSYITSRSIDFKNKVTKVISS